MTYYNLRLNRGKGVVIDMTHRHRIKSKDGTELNKVAEAQYLGGKLHADANMRFRPE